MSVFGLRGAVRAQRGGDGAGEHPRQEPAARADVGELGFHGDAPAVGECGERPERTIQQRLEPLADQPREHGRGAAGGDGDLHGRAVDDGGHDEARQLAVIHDVAGNPRGGRGRGGGGIHGAIVRGGDDEPGAFDIGGRELARVVNERAALDRGAQFIAQRRRDNGDFRSGIGQQRKLARRHFPAAHEQHGLSLDVEEEREVTHQRGSPRLRARRAPYVMM